ncbi:MAG: zinc ribbon domain-containing protein [Acidobacteria bacterium]|nr:zinc ribbon domain-containing protein [Acidobacteriota bacterium]
MPIYEYYCPKCDRNFEKLRKFSDEPLTIHDECGGPIDRLLSAPAFQFKGTGWYITDYNKTGSSSPASSGGKEPKSETKAETKSETKTETKSETKTETKAAPAATTSTPTPAKG